MLHDNNVTTTAYRKRQISFQLETILVLKYPLGHGNNYTFVARYPNADLGLIRSNSV